MMDFVVASDEHCHVVFVNPVSSFCEEYDRFMKEVSQEIGWGDAGDDIDRSAYKFLIVPKGAKDVVGNSIGGFRLSVSDGVALQVLHEKGRSEDLRFVEEDRLRLELIETYADVMRLLFNKSTKRFIAEFSKIRVSEKRKNRAGLELYFPFKLILATLQAIANYLADIHPGLHKEAAGWGISNFDPRLVEVAKNLFGLNPIYEGKAFDYLGKARFTVYEERADWAQSVRINTQVIEKYIPVDSWVFGLRDPKAAFPLPVYGPQNSVVGYAFYEGRRLKGFYDEKFQQTLYFRPDIPAEFKIDHLTGDRYIYEADGKVTQWIAAIDETHVFNTEDPEQGPLHEYIAPA